jgi:hypothetical protein
VIQCDDNDVEMVNVRRRQNEGRPVCTGTPWRVSLILSPMLTSFTASTSSVYLSRHIHCSHHRVCGIKLRWTKNPTNII